MNKVMIERVISLTVFLISVLSLPAFAQDEKDEPDKQPKPAAAKDNGEQLLLPANSQPPWKNDSEPSSLPPLQPSESARDALDNVVDSELDRLYLTDGVDQNILNKILYKLPRLGLDNVQRFVQQTTNLSWKKVLEDPQSHGMQMFSMSGRVTKIERQDLVADVAEWMGFTHYYLVQFQPDDCPTTAQLYALAIPEAWMKKEKLDERASCDGLLLKAGLAEDADSPPPLLFAVDRIAWNPDKPDKKYFVGPSQLLLAKTGMDLGLFDDVRRLNGQKLAAGDSECFYRVLSLMPKFKPDELRRAATPLDIVPYLQKPVEHHGDLVIVEGSARRISKSVVSRPYFKDRLDLPSFYEIDILVDLGNKRIKLGKDKPGKPAIVLQDTFPVTVCVRQLPPGLSVSDKLNERVRVPCFFYKLWTYQSQYTRTQDSAAKQPSPLMVGLMPELIEYEDQSNPVIGALAVGLIVLAVGGIWVGLWIFGRGDQKFQKETLNRQYEVEKGKSLNDMGIEAQDGPDFSGIDES